MKMGNGRFGLWLTCTFLLIGTPAMAISPFSQLIPFKRVEADPEGNYELRDEHGPWLILAASFAGEGADRQARELVLEMRQRYRLPAYMHSQEYDFTETVQGLSVDRYNQPQRMRYANPGRYEAIGVLVGDFASVDDPNLEKTLDKIKYARPDCLDLKKRTNSTQRFVGLREMYRRINGDEEKHNKGPMGSAFVTRNPLLPASYFAPQGVDEFVVGLNRGVKYSLLDNRGNFTVRVATFRGNETINQKQVQELLRSGEVSDKLEIAADRAHRLTMALRDRKIEAYEFHDRHESIVTIGSFASDGTELPDGTKEINPAVYRIMETYGAAREPLPGRPMVGLQPRAMEGIPFDIQPMPMPVPRASVGSAYARGLSKLR